MAQRLSRLEIQLGHCTRHGEPVLCCRCTDLQTLPPGEAAELGALFLRISSDFTPGPPQPSCPHCHGVRLCLRCNGEHCLSAAEQDRCAELLDQLQTRQKPPRQG